MARTYHHAQFPTSGLARRDQTISVIVPTRDCAATIEPIARTLAGLRDRGLIDQVLVVDADSGDGTAALATRHVETVSENALLPEFGPAQGKGDAMWRALATVTGDIVCFLDGDTEDFREHFVSGTVGPLLFEPDVAFVKAFFRRPFRDGRDADGGRVTELIARPLIRRFWPELGGIRQPLAGEMAARRDLLTRIPFSVGYAVETALLLDIHREVGLRPIVQVDLEVRQNDHKPLPDLAPMADEVLAAAMARLQREGRLAHDAGPLPLERPPLASVRSAAA